MSLFSPAKVNLFLRVVRKREDGYHDLASLFHTVSFGDTLDMEALPSSSSQDELTCNLPGVPVDSSNLVIRALNLFRQRSGIQQFFRLRLEKRIPAQAGMGGGSSNAATALFGANALCGRPATNAELLEWTHDPVIGSDSTFFFSTGAAYCTGRGEIVEPVAPLPVPNTLPIYLVKPKFGLSTPSVFKAFKLARVSKVDPEELLKLFQTKGVAHDKWVNDLETPAFEVAPELAELKAKLEAPMWEFKAVLMSGSGSTLFCVGEPAGGEANFQKHLLRESTFKLDGAWPTRLLYRSTVDDWYQPAVP